MIRREESGFTIVELTLATAFFSFIMLFAVVGFIQINRSYTRGLTVQNIQNTSREALDALVGDIRDARSVNVTVRNSPDFRVCTGAVRWAWNHSLDTNGTYSTESYGDDTSNLTLVRTSSGNCNDPVLLDPASAATESFIEDTMAVQHLSVTRIGTSNSFRIIMVISSDPTLNAGDFSTFGVNAECEVRTGDQFCDVARLETVVTARN